MAQFKVGSESLISNEWCAFQCEERLKVLGYDYHTLLKKKAICQEKRHAETVKSLVSGDSMRQDELDVSVVDTVEITNVYTILVGNLHIKSN